MNSNGEKPSVSQVKPIMTSETVELDNASAAAAGEVSFWDQFTALTYKQFLVYSRNGRATILRLLAPLFFMFLLWLLNLAVRADTTLFAAFDKTTDPQVIDVQGLVDCTQDVFIIPPCYDFIYSPINNSIVDQIVEGMRLNNPGREVSPDAVRGFASISDANSFLQANPEHVIGGVHFLLDDNSVGTAGPGLNYVLQVNSTTKYFKDRFQDPTFFSAVPLQIAVEREIARYQWQSTKGSTSDLTWNVSYSQYAHPQVGDVNIIGAAMGPFVFAANMFNFVLLLSSVVAERERGLRQALKTSGMLDSAFWLSWVVVELTISVLFTLLTIAFGAMFQFDFFLNNSFLLVFLLFLLFQWAMVGFAFLLSIFISKTSTAINLGFVIFILGWIFQTAIAFNFPYSPDNINSSVIVTVIFTLLPFGPLSKGSVDLGAASNDNGLGISWSRRSEYCQNIENPQQQDALYATAPNAYWDFECVFPLGTILGVLAIEFILYFLLAIYLNNVLADENGVRKKLWYFFSPEYWRGGAGKRRNAGPRSLKPSVHCPVAEVGIGEGAGDADVAEEEAEMKSLLQQRIQGTSGPLTASADAAHAVEVFGLQKAFGRSWFKRLLTCCTPSFCRKSSATGTRKSPQHLSSEFWAIKGSWFSIEKDQLFCLLGPNGAGKTTTINCLTGVLPPTGGDALVYGENITSSGSMERIRAMMGVCPQFDVQWGELTGTEHLYIYGRVKGLRADEVRAQSEELLESVKLTSAADQKTAAYSGGMRRRLSVAIALLGDPLVVYLDEPTTGMDPISRRHVWDAIEAAKPGRAIVLTTHSMEEADILGDTIAIMARGRVRAYGSSLRLKQKFGSGYQLSVAVSGGKMDRTVSSGALAGGVLKEERTKVVAEVFKQELGVEAPEAGAGAYTVFVVPKSAEEQLPGFLERLESRRQELHITDIQISLTSLEEVFLSIARRAEVEAAAAEGRNVEEVRLEDGSLLEVELGEEEAVQASTGRKFTVKWAQDEEGKLSVLSWTLVKEYEPPETSISQGSSGENGAAAAAGNAAATSGL